MAIYDQRAPADFKFGQLSGGITSLDTTLTSTDFATLPSDLSTTKYLPITLADDAARLYETVWITGHAGGSSAVTVVRGREGSSARAWLTGSAWRCAPTIRDTLPALTRATLPGDAHLGMRALLTDESQVVEKVTAGWRSDSTVRVKYRMAATQSLVNAVVTKVPFDTAVTTSAECTYDSGNQRFTLLRAGTWLIVTNYRFGVGSGDRYLLICKDADTSNRLGQSHMRATGEGTGLCTVAVADFAVNDLVAVYAIQSSGGALISGGPTELANHVALTWLG